MSELTMIQAVNQALQRALSDDPSVLLMGEDVGLDGGVFRATEGLFQRFGSERVLDTPLAEAGIAGVAVGLASQGFRPVVEIQFAGFAYACIDQILNHAARLRHRTCGRLSCPLVLRMPVGGGIRAVEHHSESPEAMFAHIPGLKVVIPSSPVRAYGLLLAAIRDPDPVVFLEPSRLYRAGRERVPDDGVGLALCAASIVRPGRDLTIVAWGAMVATALQAADRLAGEGIAAEIVDVATVAPLDSQTILESVARTGRLLIAHEAPLTAGFGGEIAARVAEFGLTHLLAPIQRIAGWDTIMPYPRTEHHYIPSSDRLVTAARHAMEFQ